MSRVGMKFFIRFAEMLVGDVRVYLGRGDATMAEHALDATYIGTVHEKIGSETMPHGVRTDVFRDASKTCIFAYHTLDTASA